MKTKVQPNFSGEHFFQDAWFGYGPLAFRFDPAGKYKFHEQLCVAMLRMLQKIFLAESNR